MAVCVYVCARACWQREEWEKGLSESRGAKTPIKQKCGRQRHWNLSERCNFSTSLPAWKQKSIQTPAGVRRCVKPWVASRITLQRDSSKPIGVTCPCGGVWRRPWFSIKRREKVIQIGLSGLCSVFYGLWELRLCHTREFLYLFSTALPSGLK